MPKSRCSGRVASGAPLNVGDGGEVRENRIMGDIAIIHARTTYTKPDGQAGAGRYTDVWARRQGQWRCVSAHVTRG